MFYFKEKTELFTWSPSMYSSKYVAMCLVGMIGIFNRYES